MAEPEMMETVGDVLSAAADLIVKRGWIKGSFESPKGMCVLGACNKVEMNDSSFYPASLAVAESLRDFLGTPATTWNDLRASSKRQVVRTLRLAAWVYDDQPLLTPVVRHG